MMPTPTGQGRPQMQDPNARVAQFMQMLQQNRNPGSQGQGMPPHMMPGQGQGMPPQMPQNGPGPMPGQGQGMPPQIPQQAPMPPPGWPGPQQQGLGQLSGDPRTQDPSMMQDPRARAVQMYGNQRDGGRAGQRMPEGQTPGGGSCGCGDKK